MLTVPKTGARALHRAWPTARIRLGPDISTRPLWPTASCLKPARRASHFGPPFKAPRTSRYVVSPQTASSASRMALTAAAATSLLVAVALFLYPETEFRATVPSELTRDSGPSDAVNSILSRQCFFRMSEIREHGPKSKRPWVILEDKVYDITDWIQAHPGGEIILRAAGGCLEPYWNIFPIHDKAHVREILDQYVIGKIHPTDLVDGKPLQCNVQDPFEEDPERDGRLYLHTERPCNAECPPDELSRSFLTPNEVFYVRNHMWVPLVPEHSANDHSISVELPNGSGKLYSVNDLKTKFEQHSITTVLQCSGNRRSHMSATVKPTNGLQWSSGAIGCARWEGVWLRDVLSDAGLSMPGASHNTHHVQFSSLEAYGASIPIATALDPRCDVLLAFSMNGATLPRDHGYPVRVIVPGHVAARCVKWVNRIVVNPEESQTPWQLRDYKCFGPNETKQEWSKYKSIQETPVTSAITGVRLRSTDPSHADTVPPRDQQHSDTTKKSDILRIEGYAYSGGGREIQRVDVSLDNGHTWDQATLIDDSASEKGSRAWCWKRWTYDWAVDSRLQNGETDRKVVLVVKATDAAYNTQPDTHHSIYNIRGNLATAWDRVQLDLNEPFEKLGSARVSSLSRGK